MVSVDTEPIELREPDVGPDTSVLEREPGVARRQLLRRSAAAVVGLVAIDRLAAATGPPQLLWPTSGEAQLTLTATDVRARVVGAPAGTLPTDGDQLLVTATLLLDGVDVGELHATSVHLVRPGFNVQRRVASTQSHVFHLDDGTIVGMGSGTHDDRPDDFAVVGGTGRFARATGTYRARIAPIGLGGDGTGDIHFDLTLQESSDA